MREKTERNDMEKTVEVHMKKVKKSNKTLCVKSENNGKNINFKLPTMRNNGNERATAERAVFFVCLMSMKSVSQSVKQSARAHIHPLATFQATAHIATCIILNSTTLQVICFVYFCSITFFPTRIFFSLFSSHLCISPFVKYCDRLCTAITADIVCYAISYSYIP